MRLQRDSYAPKSCAFDAANVQFLRAHLCKSHPVLQHAPKYGIPTAYFGYFTLTTTSNIVTNSGVKPRRSGRGYKPRKPGADFI